MPSSPSAAAPRIQQWPPETVRGGPAARAGDDRGINPNALQKRLGWIAVEDGCLVSQTTSGVNEGGGR